ncbi:hypothetical protein ACLOJK_011709 [Asimina triloba]
MPIRPKTYIIQRRKSGDSANFIKQILDGISWMKCRTAFKLNAAVDLNDGDRTMGLEGVGMSSFSCEAGPSWLIFIGVPVILLSQVFLSIHSFYECSVGTKFSEVKLDQISEREMLNLFLSEPSSDDHGDYSSLKESLSFLQKLESVIWSMVTSGSRSEARLWLCTTISCVNSIAPHDQCQLFDDLLRSRPRKRAIASQVLQMIFERRPQKVGHVIAKRSYILEKFFEGNRTKTEYTKCNFNNGEHLDEEPIKISDQTTIRRMLRWEITYDDDDDDDDDDLWTSFLAQIYHDVRTFDYALQGGAAMSDTCQHLISFTANAGNPRRILEWFGNFAGAGESEHRKGARALSQFAFVNRDICWDELEWKGKHGQSPAVVATKPHYFLDLDVLRTVENFLENVPDFWSSDEFAESLKNGEILHLDMKFFVDQFVSLMYEEDSEDVWAVIYEFLVEEQFSLLCQHLLILLNEHELHTFICSLSKFLTRLKCKDLSSPCCWLESLLLTCSDLVSIDELMLINAVINQRRQLLCLLHDDEHEEEKVKIQELLLSSITMSEAGHWILMKACTKMKKKDATKWLGLQSWILYYSLSKECKSSSTCELLFSMNGIRFQKSDDHSFIRPDRISKGSGSDLDHEGSVRHRHKRKAKSRKRRRKQYYSQSDSSGDELLEFEMLSGERGLQSGGASGWMSEEWHQLVGTRILYLIDLCADRKHKNGFVIGKWRVLEEPLQVVKLNLLRELMPQDFCDEK